MEWKNIKIPEGAKLYKVHNYTYMHKGVIYHLEVDEFQDGTFVGHGEHSSDKSNVLESVSGNSVLHCLEILVNKIKK